MFQQLSLSKKAILVSIRIYLRLQAEYQRRLLVSPKDPIDDAVELLQQFELKEYEARCFVALSQLSAGTAKEVASIAAVPHTRVYDSMRMLEARSLVEVKHTSPRRFRAVDIDKAVATLRAQYESRIERLTDALDQNQARGPNVRSETPELWSLVGTEAIQGCIDRLLDDADDTVVAIVGDETQLTDEFLNSIARVDDAELVIGVPTDEAESRGREYGLGAQTAFSTFDWAAVGAGEDEVTVGIILLVDESCALVSTILPSGEERAVVGTARHNGLVVLARQLTAFADR